MLGKMPLCDATLSMAHFRFACLGFVVVGSCATPQQYIYNCTAHPVVFDGKTMAKQTFEGRSSGLVNPRATYPDGSAHVPLRVASTQVDSFAHSNTWISPANVFRQFASQVVIVDLR